MGIIKKVIEMDMFLIVPLSHRERGTEGVRPVNLPH